MQCLYRSMKLNFHHLIFFLCYLPFFTFSNDIPIDVLQELSQLSFDQLVQKYGTNAAVSPDEPQSLAVSIGFGNYGRPDRRPDATAGNRMSEAISYNPQRAQEVQVAENPGCMPRETVIEMPNQNPAQVVYPAGTKIKRCTGVCGHSNLLCQSTATHVVQRKGLVLVYKSGKLTPTGYQTFNLTEDLGCGCRCQQSPDECKPNQIYEPSNCKCICRNQDDIVNCGPHRVWDHIDCKCKCPKTCRACVQGTQFDEYLCSCVPLGTRGQRPGRRN